MSKFNSLAGGYSIISQNGGKSYYIRDNDTDAIIILHGTEAADIRSESKSFCDDNIIANWFAR